MPEIKSTSGPTATRQPAEQQIWGKSHPKMELSSTQSQVTVISLFMISLFSVQLVLWCILWGATCRTLNLVSTCVSLYCCLRLWPKFPVISHHAHGHTVSSLSNCWDLETGSSSDWVHHSKPTGEVEQSKRLWTSREIITYSLSLKLNLAILSF